MDASISKAFDLTGRVAVVTGAGGGIGREAAAVFAAAGARVVIGDVKTDGLFETVRVVEAVGGGRSRCPPTCRSAPRSTRWCRRPRRSSVRSTSWPTWPASSATTSWSTPPRRSSTR